MYKIFESTFKDKGHEFTMFYMTSAERDICRIQGKTFFTTCEELVQRLDSNFYIISSESFSENPIKDFIPKDINLLHSFEEYSEFKELFAEFLI